MNSPSKVQIELLTLIAAKPYGYGLKIKQAAKLLHLKYDAARYQLKKFKVSFPERWSAIQGLKSLSKSQKKLDRDARHSLKHPLLIGALDFANESLVPGNKKLWMDNDDLAIEDDSITSKMAYLKIKERF